MSTYLDRRGGNWVTEDAEICFLPPADTTRNDASCLHGRNGCGNVVNRAGGHRVSVTKYIRSVHKCRFSPYIIVLFVIIRSGPPPHELPCIT